MPVTIGYPDDSFYIFNFYIFNWESAEYIKIMQPFDLMPRLSK